MVSVSLSNEWELTLKKLQNDVTCSFYCRLMLSYDALAGVVGYGISLQLCFLCLAGFSKGHVYSNDVIDYWIREGLVAERDPL